jgi:hypothetical protein
MIILLPIKQALCLLRALGTYTPVFTARIVPFYRSTVKISFKSLLNLPPKI